MKMNIIKPNIRVKINHVSHKQVNKYLNFTENIFKGVQIELFLTLVAYQ